MGFISDRIAADRCAYDYVQRLTFPGIAPKIARKSQAALKNVVERGFMTGMTFAREGKTPTDATSEEFVTKIVLPPETPPDAAANARKALRLAYDHGLLGGYRYGREHPT